MGNPSPPKRGGLGSPIPGKRGELSSYQGEEGDDEGAAPPGRLQKGLETGAVTGRGGCQALKGLEPSGALSCERGRDIRSQVLGAGQRLPVHTSHSSHLPPPRQLRPEALAAKEGEAAPRNQRLKCPWNRPPPPPAAGKHRAGHRLGLSLEPSPAGAHCGPESLCPSTWQVAAAIESLVLQKPARPCLLGLDRDPPTRASTGGGGRSQG